MTTPMNTPTAPLGSANHFDAAATTWDENPRRRKMAVKVARAIVRRAGLRPEWDLIDFGRGTGLLGLALLPHVRSVTGGDSSRGMLDILQAKIDAAGLSNMRTLLFDFDRDEPQGLAFDVITMNLVLHHLKDIDRAIATCRRMLRPGGIVCIADLDTEPGTFHEDGAEHVHHHGFDRSELKSHLGDHGFTAPCDETVYVIEKPDKTGTARKYPVFLVTAICGGTERGFTGPSFSLS